MMLNPRLPGLRLAMRLHSILEHSGHLILCHLLIFFHFLISGIRQVQGHDHGQGHRKSSWSPTDSSSCESSCVLSTMYTQDFPLALDKWTFSPD